ncbi:PAS domain S-box protein [Pontimicrobium aquaticum]|uniref:histidine kinase n=1 Tax=Pontimicrobium aquaticum TaxID=2565367 RepID=A0A4U0EZG9_9FLAO|nr:PAS domain S-box protein [Pontimicrobium aquaticum]TJY35772.1 PAS domain S-box protein [Pontimicrobium aquaticum]
MFKQDQEIFNILLESISQGVIIVDEHQTIIEVNKYATKIFGYSQKELIGQHLNILIPKQYHTNHTSHFKSFIKDGKRREMGKQTMDIYGVKKSGSSFPVKIELNPFYIYRKLYTMALINDLSAKKKIKKKLLLKKKALKSASNGIIITDALKADNPIIYFNPAFQKLTGYSKEEILHKNCRFLQKDDKQQKAITKLKNAVNNGKSCRATLRNYKKDGTLFWNDLQITPIKNKKGVVTHFIGILNDITRTKSIEEERNHLANIFNESLNEIHVFDAKTLKFINVNYGAQKSLGYTLDEFINMTPIDITPFKNEVELRKTIDVLQKKNIEKLELETVHYRKDGTKYPVKTHLQLSKLGDRDVYVAIILDITEQKKHTNELEETVAKRTEELKAALAAEKELNELKTKFLSLVSHEFKTPLSGILTSTILLSKYTQEDQQHKRDKHIKTITDEVHHLNNILTDFLSIERLDKGKYNYKFSTFKVSKVINEVIYNANMLLKEGQHINYPSNIDELSLHQDEKVIELALSNLLQNAIKYSDENTVIDINVTQTKDTTVFKIKDYGIGIPLKDQKNIFNRYFRAENVLLTQGTGIGLNIVKDHLNNLKGEIYFESIENKGSTFTIEIPNIADQ